MTKLIYFRFFILFLSLLGIKTPIFAQKPQKEPQNPKIGITWNTLSHDFGEIRQGNGVTFDFIFTNNTPDSLTIDNIRTTCGCTAASWQQSAVQPHTASTIPVQFDATESGYFEKTIKVYFNKIKKPVLLVISGEVKGLD